MFPMLRLSLVLTRNESLEELKRTIVLYKVEKVLSLKGVAQCKLHLVSYALCFMVFLVSSCLIGDGEKKEEMGELNRP